MDEKEIAAGVDEGRYRVVQNDEAKVMAEAEFDAEIDALPPVAGAGGPIDDSVLIRMSLESTLERLLYLKNTAHDRNAESALRREYKDMVAVLERFDAQHPF